MDATVAFSARGSRELLACVCVASSGIHARLVTEHLEDGLVATTAFALAVVSTGVIGVALLARPESHWPPRAAAIVLAGLLAVYALAVSVAVPGLPRTPESVDALGVACKSIEAAGLLPALALAWPPREPTRAARGTA